MTQIIFLAYCLFIIFARIYFVAKKNNDNSLFFVLIVAVILRYIVGWLNYEIGPFPGAEIDAVEYEMYAKSIARDFWAPNSGFNIIIGTGDGNNYNNGPGVFPVETGRLGYSSILAVFFILFGYHPQIPVIINIFFVVNFIIVVYGIARYIANRRTAIITAAFIAIYPLLVLYSAVPLRQAILMWGVSVFFRGALDYYFGKKKLINLYTTSSFIVMSFLNDGYSVVLLFLVVAWWMKNRQLPLVKRGAIAGVLIGLVMIFLVTFGQTFFTKLPSDLISLTEPSFWVTLRERKSSYGAGYGGSISGSWESIIKHGPTIFLGFLSSPFPFWIDSTEDTLKSIDGILNLTLVILSIFSVFTLKGDFRVRCLLLLIYFGVFWFVFSMGTANIGIAIRHRTTFIWMPFLIVAFSLLKNLQAPKRRQY